MWGEFKKFGERKVAAHESPRGVVGLEELLTTPRGETGVEEALATDVVRTAGSLLAELDLMRRTRELIGDVRSVGETRERRAEGVGKLGPTLLLRLCVEAACHTVIGWSF